MIGVFESSVSSFLPFIHFLPLKKMRILDYSSILPLPFTKARRISLYKAKSPVTSYHSSCRSNRSHSSVGSHALCCTRTQCTGFSLGRSRAAVLTRSRSPSLFLAGYPQQLPGQREKRARTLVYTYIAAAVGNETGTKEKEQTSWTALEPHERGCCCRLVV